MRPLIVGDQAVLRAGEGTRGYLLLRGRNPTAWHHSGCLQLPARRFQVQRPSAAGTVNSTRFVRVIGKLGIQQIYALSPQAKRRVDRMLETFWNRLVTGVHLAAASTIDEAGLVPK